MISDWQPLFPGWALDPPGWSDRSSRPGWFTRYTTVGARPAHIEVPLDDRPLANALSAVLVATPRPADDSISDDVKYWVTLARRLLQRGTNPSVGDGARASPTAIDASALWHLFAPTDPLEVNPALELDDTYERDLFDHLRTGSPAKAAFLIPQAPLEGTGDGQRGTTTQWVDFLFAPPGGRPVVFEIDGRQHQIAKAVDRQRDLALEQRGVRTIRQKPSRGRLDASPFIEEFRRISISVGDPELASKLRAAIDAARLCFGLIEAVATGALRPAGRWTIDSGEVARPVVERLLTAFAAFDVIWSTAVVPSAVEFTGVEEWTWSNPFGGLTGDSVSIARIVVDWGPTWKQLPTDGAADVVVRGVPLPSHAGWDSDLSSERRSMNTVDFSDKELERALACIADVAYGISSFRVGQVRAMTRVLRGGDACVLLPTGHGKTLIYQMSILLRPGLTIVVAPITSLIDDQERRFLAAGIDRVAAIHGGRTSDDLVKSQLGRSVAGGAALVTFTSPERLQIQRFRSDLAGATAHRLVALAVVDEAHCVSEWGHDFRTSYLRLGRNLRRLCADKGGKPPPLLALTGTASRAVLTDVLRELDIDESEPDALQSPNEFDRPNLHFHVLRGLGKDSAFPLLHEAIIERVPAALGKSADELVELRGTDTSSGIVFVPWSRGEFGVRKAQHDVIHWLKETGITNPQVDVFSGRNPDADAGDQFDRAWSEEKVATAHRFQQNELAILVATKAFGMGIDKPNIYWTAHLGIPSSIEAFAQEAGRAGRDADVHAQCVLVSGQEDEATIGRLLDPATPSGERKKLFIQLDPRDDVGRQLFFIYNSFPGIETEQPSVGGVGKAINTAWVHGEHAQAVNTWQRLREFGGHPNATITIPRLPPGTERFGEEYCATIRNLVDKALFRLSLIGIIDDLTIDYGADKVTVVFANFNLETIDDALVTFADRIETGRHDHHASVLDEAPSDLDRRIDHHLKYVIELVYKRIEPGRVNALREMWRLTLNEPDDARIRNTIASHLRDGPTASVLTAIAMAPSIDLSDALARLDATPPIDPFDWSGAAGRLLESFPGHPVVLAVRAVGESHLPSGDVREFRAQIRELLENLDTYRIDRHAAGQLFDWFRSALVDYDSGRRERWLLDVWALWRERFGVDDVIDDRSIATLSDPNSNPYDRDGARAYRLASIASQLEPIPQPFGGD